MSPESRKGLVVTPVNNTFLEKMAMTEFRDESLSEEDLNLQSLTDEDRRPARGDVGRASAHASSDGVPPPYALKSSSVW